MSYKIGVDGGGSKTECILVDAAGEIIARHLAPGCNPNVVGVEQARLIVTDALCALLAQAKIHDARSAVAATRLFMSGAPGFWQEFAAQLEGFGLTSAAPDSLPVLELATDGRPGLVIHSGTGSFVAARAPDGAIHYAGGLGWRFGDPGSGYDLGRRAISRALLELQGWSTPSRLSVVVRDHCGLEDAGAITRFFYQDSSPNAKISALAPHVLHLATEGDLTAHQILLDSTVELLELAARVATTLFPGTALDTLPAGLSGPILTHPTVLQALAPRSPLAFRPVEGSPIEGVRRLLRRT